MSTFQELSLSHPWTGELEGSEQKAEAEACRMLELRVGTRVQDLNPPPRPPRPRNPVQGSRL